MGNKNNLRTMGETYGVSICVEVDSAAYIQNNRFAAQESMQANINDDRRKESNSFGYTYRAGSQSSHRSSTSMERKRQGFGTKAWQHKTATWRVNMHGKESSLSTSHPDASSAFNENRPTQ